MINVNNDKHLIQCIFESDPQNGAAKDTNKHSEETLEPPNVSIIPLCTRRKEGLVKILNLLLKWRIKILNHTKKMT